MRGTTEPTKMSSVSRGGWVKMSKGWRPRGNPGRTRGMAPNWYGTVRGLRPVSSVVMLALDRRCLQNIALDQSCVGLSVGRHTGFA